MRILALSAIILSIAAPASATSWRHQERTYIFTPGVVPAQPQVQAPIYSYSGGPNYCPANLRPVVINGVICCGQANRGSYTAAMQHPVPRAAPRVVRTPRRARVVCPVGEKGCNTNY